MEVAMPTEVCSHVAEFQKKVKPQTKGCEECLKMGDTWLHLRMCLDVRAGGLLRLVKESSCAGSFQ